MRRNPAVLIVVSAFCSFVLTACGGGTSSSGQSTTASNPAPSPGSSQPGSGSGGSNSGGSGSGSAGSGSSGAGSGGGSGSGSSGAHVYVYAGDTNSIAAFSVAADGTTTAVPGSPFALAASDMVADPHGNFLFGESSNLSAQSGHSNTYFSYAVAANGGLTQAATAAPLSEPGANVQPAYLGWLNTDRSGSTLYGLQLEASGNAWVGAYHIGSDGTLTGAQASSGAGQTEISFTPDDRFGYVARRYRTDGFIWEYSRNGDGTLTVDPRSQTGLIWSPPPGSKATTPDYLQVSPTGNYVAVIFLDTANANGQSGVAVYPINSDGTLGASTPLLVFSPPQKYQAILTWDTSGTYIFISYFGGIATYRYDAGTGQLIPIEAELNGGTPPTDMAFFNGHLFAINYDSPYLFIYNFNSATQPLTASSSSQIALGFNPTSVAALQH